MSEVVSTQSALGRHHLLGEQNPLVALLLAGAVLGLGTGCALEHADGELTGTQEEAQQKPPGGTQPPPSIDYLVTISAGQNHTCVQRKSGKTWCWGLDDYGESGPASVACIGGTQCVKKPSLVATGQVSVGHDHTCILDASSHALCWGANHHGQLGTGTTSVSPTLPAAAVPVALNGTPMTFSQLSAGYLATCGVTTGTGQVYCWGAFTQANHAGSATPLPVTNPPGQIILDRIGFVTTGGAYSCIQWQLTNGLGVDTECWSRVTDALAPQYATVTFGSTSVFKRLASGFGATCTDMSNGTVQCFGANESGQLGNGTTSISPTTTPVTVGGGMALRLVTTGVDHTCALDGQGYAYCWGRGTSNQLGQMTATVPAASSPNPVAVAAFDQNGAPVRFTALAAGDLHTCGISTTDHVYCWGNNGWGQLGTGTWIGGATMASQAVDPI
jgi:alpha-tubulin suppressor-like RCC1 family protein